MAWLLMAIGLVLVFEGLVFALAPSRLEEALDFLRRLSPEIRRLMGLTAVSVGVILIWVARSLGI